MRNSRAAPQKNPTRRVSEEIETRRVSEAPAPTRSRTKAVCDGYASLANASGLDLPSGPMNNSRAAQENPNPKRRARISARISSDATHGSVIDGEEDGTLAGRGRGIAGLQSRQGLVHGFRRAKLDIAGSGHLLGTAAIPLHVDVT